ncbi:MAG: GNAT family N-acetyltransferase [Beijerinckiaceae bacterium]|nr:GNAT family N-acetyltransferase [Beijerinckiaceae bacterium]
MHETKTGAFSLRDHEVGDLGLIIHHQARIYFEEYGWNIEFEGLLAEISAAFIKNFKPGREGCWVAEKDGRMLGSVMIVEEAADVAKLRMLWVSPAARGLGVGARLVDQAIAFSRKQGYSRIVLWTHDVLHAAIAIYRKRGFVLTGEQPNHAFGHDLVSQTWELKL